MQTITQKDVDEVLENGDALHQIVAMKLKSLLDDSMFLTTDDLPSSFAVGNYEYSAHYYDSIYDKLQPDQSTFESLDVVIPASVYCVLLQHFTYRTLHDVFISF